MALVASGTASTAAGQFAATNTAMSAAITAKPMRTFAGRPMGRNAATAADTTATPPCGTEKRAMTMPRAASAA
ncbi:MAG: hypothetical protein U0169_20035 [Polyangiaceae bacterium]